MNRNIPLLLEYLVGEAPDAILWAERSWEAGLGSDIPYCALRYAPHVEQTQLEKLVFIELLFQHSVPTTMYADHTPDLFCVRSAVLTFSTF